LIKLIEHIEDRDIVQLEVANAVPLVLELGQKLEVVRRFNLGTAATPPSEIL
jgi:bisphosphoglycerate-dependent phosphoglycerate mutase